MSAPAASHPSRSPVTWLLALVFLVGIDAAITRTSLLWGPTAFENGGGARVVFPQTYRVARKLYAPERDAALRVVLLGNSRVVLALTERRLEQAIAGVDPDLDVAVSNLGIFGSFMAETAMLARHLGPLDPELVVVALGAPDLLREPIQRAGGEALSVLQIGLRDGPLPAASQGERVDRWLRTFWPLYRFREFAREAILDRVLARPDPGPGPEQFETREALFAHLYGDRAAAVAAAWQRWQGDRGLAAYAGYLEAVDAGHLARGKARAASRERLGRETPAVVAFDALLSELERSGRRTVVLLMPENPILELDASGEFHRNGLSEEASRLVRTIAAERGARVLDARALLPVESFLDFDHPVLEVDALEAALAEEIADVARQ